MRILKVSFFRRSKVSIIIANFVPEVKRTIRRSKVKINFQYPEKIVSYKYNQEIKS
jgi:hypothetical protein